MKKRFVSYLAILGLLPVLCGCTAIGEKTASLSIIYAVTAILSLLVLIGYCSLVSKKEVWFLVLLASVLVVNAGYFTLSVSSSLQEALWANRVSYLGSVFLPMSILMIILKVTNIKYRKWLPYLLISVAVVIFFIAASPGYLDIYYKEVSLQIINGVSSLRKVYGPLHPVYLFYLLFYFAAMIATILYAAAKKKIDTTTHAAILALAVFVNIGVWFIEQLVHIEFEILSVSYIISELFLVGLHLIMSENERLQQIVKQNEAALSTPEQTPSLPTGQTATDQQKELFLAGVDGLTPTERTIYEAYIIQKKTKEVMAQLSITENTLKFHNKNIYGKLGVSSRKQLLEIYNQLHAAGVPGEASTNPDL